MGVRERGDQFRRLARAAIADLFDQRHPFGRLALTHVLMIGGDTLFAVSLAGSLFFSISPTAAQGKVLLYLLLTMAPFAVVAPALGPLVDRSRGARRAMVVSSALGRAILCPFLARDIHTLLLFPEAFAMLVLSKVYLVTKGALVPEMAAQGMLDQPAADRSPTDRLAPVDGPPFPGHRSAVPTPTPPYGTPATGILQGGPDLASLNARLGLLASLSGFVFILPGVALLKLGSASWVLSLDLVVFVAAVIAATRLPVQHRRGARVGRIPVVPVTEPVDHRSAAARGVVSLRGGTALPLPGGALDAWDAEDLAAFRPIAGTQVLLALVPMSILRGLTGFLTFLFAFGLRREGAATWWFGLLLGAVTAGSLVGVLLVSRIRRVLTEQQILMAGLCLVAIVAAVGSIESARLVQAVVAFALGVAGSISKPSFDALVQRTVAKSNQGRAFARFETRLQLVWVVGGFFPVVLTLPIPAGDVVISVVAAVGVVSYLSSRRAVRDHT